MTVVMGETLTLVEAKSLTEEIRRAVARTFESMADVEEAVSRAYAGRAWHAMGYSSWEDYCSAEFAQTRLWTAVEDRQARVRALRDAGLSQRAIAAVLGVHNRTVARDLPNLSTAAYAAVDKTSVDRDQDEDVDRAHLPAAVEGLDGKKRPASKPVTEDLVKRRLAVARLADAGLSQEQIAARVGVSQPTVSMDLREMGALEASAPEAMREVIASPEMTYRDVMTRFELVTLPKPDLGRIAAAVARDLSLQAQALHADVVFDDEWVVPAQRRSAVAALVPEVGDALLVIATALKEIDAQDLPEDEQVRLRWSHTVTQIRDLLARVVTL